MSIGLSSQKIPELRFPGYSDNWKVKKLGEISNFWNGKAHEQDISEHGKYIVVNSKFISQNGNIKKYSDTQISPLKKNDIVIVMSDIPNGKAIGKCFLIDQDEKYTLNQRIGGIRSKEIISSFLFRVLNRNKYFLKFDNGVSQTNLRKDEVLGCPIIFPIITEQEKIVSFLDYTDGLINNLKDQKENLESYKKGIMQKIFSQEIRFKDKNGKYFFNWEEKRLGAIVKFLRGAPVSKSDARENGRYPYIMYGELFVNYKEIIGNIKSKIDKDVEPKSKIGDILMPSSDVTPTGLATASAIFKSGVVLGGDINILRPVGSDFDSHFLSYLINFNKKSILRLVTGSMIKHIYISEIKNIAYKIPSLPEQQKIGEFLTSIDKIIESKQQQITMAEQWRKGLVQKLFI